MAVNRMFRVCPSTGLTYHQPAEKLIRWNAVAGVVALLVGGILALLVTLTRWQASGDVRSAMWSRKCCAWRGSHGIPERTGSFAAGRRPRPFDRAWDRSSRSSSPGCGWPGERARIRRAS